MVCADWIRSCERSISRTASAWITCKIAIIIIKFLFITHTCNGVIKPTILWLILSTIMNGVIKSSSQIYCCHGRVAASKAYNYYQLREVSSCWPMSRTVSAWITCKTSGRIQKQDEGQSQGEQHPVPSGTRQDRRDALPTCAPPPYCARPAWAAHCLPSLPMVSAHQSRHTYRATSLIRKSPPP